jgi:hypothetical protein
MKLRYVYVPESSSASMLTLFLVRDHTRPIQEAFTGFRPPYSNRCGGHSGILVVCC